jgi:hypothetical protein
MDRSQGDFNSMPIDYDKLTGTHTGVNYVGFYVEEEVTFTSITTGSGAKSETTVILAGVFMPIPFTAITITGGKILGLIG